jgi:hypothetical protein
MEALEKLPVTKKRPSLLRQIMDEVDELDNEKKRFYFGR